MMKVEFFHDVICSFCFPLSYRMRLIKQQFPDIEIIHRSYALIKDEQDFIDEFGSRRKAKQEILSHWHHANRNDDLHRFNIDGMHKTTFPFPSSMNGLLAARAAEIMQGSDAYWDVFDALQNALFVKNQNIEDLNIIEDVVESVGIDLNHWKKVFNDTKTMDSVLADIELAKDYNITSVPYLVINGKHRIRGAQSLQTIAQSITTLQPNIPQSSRSCVLVNGELNCE